MSLAYICLEDVIIRNIMGVKYPLQQMIVISTKQ